MPESAQENILTINGGSSSIKFATYTRATTPARVIHGAVQGIGTERCTLVWRRGDEPQKATDLKSGDHRAAVEQLVAWIKQEIGIAEISGIGHRIVHGGPKHLRPERVTPQLLRDLQEIVPLDPDHLPEELLLLEQFAHLIPDAPQVACFDTAFFEPLPAVATRLPIPRIYAAAGVRRYGFHGLSYAYLMQQLAVEASATEAAGRIILAHLGSGASIAAVRAGQPLDTSMSFTPTAGLMMGTRTGDLDPGVLLYLLRKEGQTADAVDEIINQKSGLLGISETTSDMRLLLEREKSDPRAAEAVESFCYSVKKYIGAYAAALGGVDTLIFSGGIGENVPVIRERICAGLEFLGIQLDSEQNAANAPLISADGAAVKVRVIKTDEEQMIARATAVLLAGPQP